MGRSVIVTRLRAVTVSGRKSDSTPLCLHLRSVVVVAAGTQEPEDFEYP